MRPIRIFCLCSPQDRVYRAALGSHLRLLQERQVIEFIHQGSLPAGAEREPELVRMLKCCDLILILVSADFFAAIPLDLVEMVVRDRMQGGAEIVPILLRPMDWQLAPFGKLVPLPANEIPVTCWVSADAAWEHIVEEIRQIVDVLQGKLEEGEESTSFGQGDRKTTGPRYSFGHFRADAMEAGPTSLDSDGTWSTLLIILWIVFLSILSL